MKAWDLTSIGVRAHMPEIIASGRDARAVVICLPAGERLQEHRGHERAWRGVRHRYVRELSSEHERLAELRHRARRGGVTLVFAAREPRLSNASVLASVLRGLR